MATGNKQRRGGGGGEDVVDSVCSVIALVLVMVACIDLCDAATVLNVYRLIQYDLAGSPFGSRLAAVNHHAGSFPFAPSADLSRTIVILPLREVNVSFIREYIAQRKPLGGLLFLLPGMSYSDKEGFDGGDQNFEEELLRNVLVELEQLLIHSHLPYPVYFAYEDDDINAVLADVKKNDVTGQPATATMSGYKLVASVPEPKKIASPTTTNIQGWLRGLKGDGDSNQLPTIAIVASYDTFGAAPALSVGNDSNRSGIAALLEIARLFSLLYSNPKTRGRYNLLFGLTSGGPYNYNGTDKWLRSFDQRVRESIDYAICLNNIGLLDNKLWIHVSKPPENALIKQILEDFSTMAEELNVVVGLKHKKINISNPREYEFKRHESFNFVKKSYLHVLPIGKVVVTTPLKSKVAWEHEQFSRFRVTAATLSGLSGSPGFLESSGGLLDRSNFASETAIIRSVKLVAESLARHIYAHQGRNIQIFVENSSLAVNPSYVHSLLDLLSRTPRVAPFLSKHDPFIVALEKELSGHTAEVNVQHEVLDGMFTFFDNTRATLNIYQVASVTFDLLFVLVLGSYLIVLFSFLVITTRGLDDLISLFRRPPSRKVKNV